MISSLITVHIYDRAFILSGRQIVLDKVDDEGDEPREAKVHNSLTTDGVSMPVLPKGKKTIDLCREPMHTQLTEVTVCGAC